MKRICVLFIVILLGLIEQSYGQLNRYLITFKDKSGTTYSLSNPSQFLSQRALARRLRYNISIDSADIPVVGRYIDSVRLSGDVTILNISKWMNQISIYTTDAAALSSINNFPFVIATTPIASKFQLNDYNKFLSDDVSNTYTEIYTSKITGNYFDYGLSTAQIKIHKGQFLHNHGFSGNGMQLAVIDDGFFRYDILPTFDSARNNNQILGTWDFVSRDTSVADDDSHGMHCFSAIAANMPGVFVGTAPKTSFYLFRTEDISSEYPIEEHNLCVASERADSLGVDLCSISLGYNQFSDPSFNYTYNDMNGNTSISAKAVDMAARKGLLMIVAAGNEGNNSWRYISTPADADSCMAIGAVDTLGTVATFSSYGPSSDGQIKPSVAAVGRRAVVANENNGGLPSYGNGTSYACPNMAGITTCLWQAFQEANNMQIINALQKSANNANSPNDRTGYGIPDAMKAFVILQKQFSTNEAIFSQCKALINISIKTDSTMKIELERKFPTDSNYILLTTFQNNGNYDMHQFNYTDDLSGTDYGFVSYRYKIIIDADTSYYLDSAIVNYLNNCKIIIPVSDSILIAPNPVRDILNIKLSRIKDTKVTIKIHNSIGQKIYDYSFPQIAGTVNTSIPFAAYSKVIYFVSVYFNDKKEITQKIIRQ